MNSGELGVDAVAAVLPDVVALVALGGAVGAVVVIVSVDEGVEGLGLVGPTSGTLDWPEVVRDGPLLVAEDLLVVVGSLPTWAADGEAFEGVLTSLLVVCEGGSEEDGDLVRAALGAAALLSSVWEWLRRLLLSSFGLVCVRVLMRMLACLRAVCVVRDTWCLCA